MAGRTRQSALVKAARLVERENAAKAKARKKERHAKYRRAVGWCGRTIWVGRRPVGLFYATGVLLLVSRFLSGRSAALPAVAICGVVTALVVFAFGRSRGWPNFHSLFLLAAVLYGAGWLAAVTVVGASTPMPGVLLAAAIVGAVPWSIRLRNFTLAEEPPEPTVEINDYIARFEASAPGYLPQNTRLHSIENVTVDDDGDGEPDMLGVAGIIQLPVGARATWRDIAAARPNLAATWGVAEESIEVELCADRVPDKARVLILNRRNPSHDVTYYDRSWMVLKDGCYPMGVFPDGTRSWQRLYLPKSGPVHSLISGDTGSGKSRGMSAAILQASMTGLCIPFVADPQGGQSMPAWAGPRGKAVWIADNVDEINVMVDALVRLMRDRSRRLARREFVDEDGDTWVGLDYHDPADVPDMPIIDWYLDEAKDVLEDRELGEKIEKAARMFRKAGCRMTLGTQYPAIEDLGNRMGLRLQLQTGNVVSYKLGSMVGKTMVLPSWAPNPADIPEIGENGEHTKGMNFTKTSAPGGNRATFNRTTRVKNEHKSALAAAERIPDMPQADQDAMGDDWFKRWERREAAEHAPVVIPLAAARDPQPAEPAIPASGRAADKILAYLATDDANGRTGVIAERCNIPIGTAGSALKTLAESRKIVSAGYGMWALPEMETV